MIDNAKAARNKKIAHAIMWIVLLILFLCFIFPFLMVLINVFKDKADITRDPLSLIGATKGFILTNFPQAMQKMNFWTVFGNSLIVTVCSTILTIVVSSMTAFVIVRNSKWKFCTIIFSLMIASMVIPFQVLMVPLVSVYGGTLGVLNHRITLILMHVGFSVSMAMFMFHGAIKTNIPLELEEAATIDGCNRWQTYWKIVFPLLKPTVATVAIINAMAYWNDYLLPSLVLTKKELYTIPIATQAFYGTYYRPRHGGPAARDAADPDPVRIPAALYRGGRYLRRCQGLISIFQPLHFIPAPVGGGDAS